MCGASRSGATATWTFGRSVAGAAALVVERRLGCDDAGRRPTTTADRDDNDRRSERRRTRRPQNATTVGTGGRGSKRRDDRGDLGARHVWFACERAAMDMRRALDDLRERMRLEERSTLLGESARPRTSMAAGRKRRGHSRIIKIHVKIYPSIAWVTSFHTDKNRYYT